MNSNNNTVIPFVKWLVERLAVRLKVGPEGKSNKEQSRDKMSAETEFILLGLAIYPKFADKNLKILL